MPVPHQPVERDPAPESTVEFGSSPEPARRRWSTGLPHGLAADRRVVPIAASLAAVAAFASLISEWQLTTVDRSLFGGQLGKVMIPTETGDLGPLGTGYLIGVFGVVVALVLTMFGPVASRHHARLSGLGVAGTLLAVVLALGVTLGGQSRTISRLYTAELAESQIQIAYGRGLWCALAAASLALLALHLAGRHLPAAPAADSPQVPADEEEDATAVWSWRRPVAAGAEPDDGPDADGVRELTVAPAKPFTSGADDRDEPNRSGRPGISG